MEHAQYLSVRGKKALNNILECAWEGLKIDDSRKYMDQAI